MKTKFQLTKLSSGNGLYLETEDSYVLKNVLNLYCCQDCQKEAIDKMDRLADDMELEQVYQLLGTACGAEFWLDEKGENTNEQSK